MDSFKKQYEEVASERQKIIDRLRSLKNDDIVKIYLDLCEQETKLTKQQQRLFREMKFDEYSSCNHIWVRIFKEYDSWEGRSYYSCGCIKCGLDQRVLDEEERYYDRFPLTELEHLIMYEFMLGYEYSFGIDTEVLCDFDLAKAIYSRIKVAHPDIDDETARKYFEIALDHIRNIKVSDARKQNRAKRLLLSSKFNKWNAKDVCFRS